MLKISIFVEKIWSDLIQLKILISNSGNLEKYFLKVISQYMDLKYKLISLSESNILIFKKEFNTLEHGYIFIAQWTQMI